MKFIDLFAGIGGFRYGFEKQGFECVFTSEWDKEAQQAYQLLHGDKPYGDITQINEKDVPDHDILCAGFPCQPFSIAGKQRGFEDTRGTLFFDIVRVASEKKPRYIVLENVRNLLSHDGGNTFLTILSALDAMGYDAEWQVLASSSHGLPQRRQRVYVVATLRGQSRGQVFPITGSTKGTTRQIIKGPQGMRVYDPSGIAVTMSALGGGWGAKTGLYILDDGIRRLTPREVFRVQGFDEHVYETLSPEFNDNALYRFGGNAVSVPVVEAIAYKIKELEQL